MDKMNFLVISPYKGMDEIVGELIRENNDITAECYVANLNEAAELFKTINIADYDAIISRGGTAMISSKLTDLPVFDVGISSLDVLRTIRLAENFGQRIAIVGFENITKTVHMVCEVLEWDYLIVTINSEEEVKPKLMELKEQGYPIIVSDTIAAKTASELGMNGVLISSGYETINSALSQAIRLTKSYNRSRLNLSLLTIAQGYAPYDCTIIDDGGNIVISSLEFHDSNNILAYIKEHLSEIRSEEAEGFERPLHGGVLSFNKQTRNLRHNNYLFIYTRFHERLEIRKIDAIEMISPETLDLNENTFYTSSHYRTSTQKQIERFSHTLTPVLIIGEEGTGKDRAAVLLQKNSTYQSSVFYKINCDTATAKNWNYLLSHHESPLLNNMHTIYFQHADAIPQSIFQKLLSFMSDTGLAKRNRLIFSFVAGSKKTNVENQVKALLKIENCLTLNLPSLRERVDDIPYLCTLYINRLNTKLGKQIVGFDSQALHAMKTYIWEGNLDQLKRIIEQLMLITGSSYISYENTMTLLSRESALWNDEKTQSYHFNLNQNLNDINYDIIRYILKEENGNHSKTAERLGISRSTLWRILKSKEES